MADVNIIPKVRCDNCGHIEEKHKGQFDKEYRKPRKWGSAKMEGGRSADSYGSKVRLDFTDLCETCANAAVYAAADALRKCRGEGATHE